MKIVHIAICLRGGGIQSFLVSLLPEQVKMGHKVSLIVIEEFDNEFCNISANKMIERGVQVVCLDKKRNNKCSLIRTLELCRSIIKKEKPDIVNTHGDLSHFYGSLSTIGTHIMQCCTIHSAPEKWSKLIKFTCFKRPLIFCSRSACEKRTQNNPVSTVIDNGISPEIVWDVHRTDLRTELRLNKSDKIIVLAGSLRPLKNYEFLKDIVKALHNTSIHFCICGGNYGKGYINPDVFKNEPNIHCLGVRSDVSAIENVSDVFLSCSTHEGLPIAVLEAYFNGVPCVLSPIEQHINISNVSKVWVPKSFTATDFAESIRLALECKDSHEAIYQMRKLEIEKYSISSTAQKYLDFYNKILHE